MWMEKDGAKTFIKPEMQARFAAKGWKPYVAPKEEPKKQPKKRQK